VFFSRNKSAPASAADAETISRTGTMFINDKVYIIRKVENND
jgi:hypothetical protein